MKLLKTLFIGITIIFCFGLTTNFIIKKLVLKDYKIKSNKDVLVFGDSHAECSFYDKDNTIQNFGANSEYPNLTLLKVPYLMQNHSDKNIVISIGPHNISLHNEKLVYERDSTGARLSKCWSIMDNNYLLNTYNELPIKTQLVLNLKKLCGAPNVGSNFNFKQTFKGGFYKGKDTSIINIQQAYRKHIGHFGTDVDYLKQNSTTASRFINDYDQLIKYFLLNNNNVIVVGTPVHQNYYNLLLSEQIKNYKNYLKQLKVKYPSIKIFDYSNLQYDDSCFLDSDHLNPKGAKLFTSMILKDIYQ